MGETAEITTLNVDPALRDTINGLAEAVKNGGLRDPERRQAFDGMSSCIKFRPGINAYMAPEVARVGGAQGLEFARPYLGPGGLKAYYGGGGSESMRFNQPDLPELHTDRLLTEISVLYRNEEFIAPILFPRLQVQYPSDLFLVFPPGAWFRDEGTSLVRGIGAAAVRGSWSTATGNYRTERYTFEFPIDDLQRRAADQPINLDELGTMFVTDKIDLRYELFVANLVQTGANWTSGAVTLTHTWDDYTLSTPFTDAMTARLFVRQNIGRRPNTLVLGVQSYETLSLHPALLERVKYTGTNESPAMVTANMIAALFQAENVLIGGAIKNTAAETVPDTFTPAFVWGKIAFWAYVPPTPAREIPAAGYGFTLGRRIDRYRDERVTSDIIRGEESFDVQVTAPAAGYLISPATA